MPANMLILVALSVAGFSMFGCTKPEGQATTVAQTTARTKIDFETRIKPLFESRCTPCHFAGGKVYERLPFDDPETIKRLGTKLFTRLKDEKEQRLIREFLAE